MISGHRFGQYASIAPSRLQPTHCMGDVPYMAIINGLPGRAAEGGDNSYYCYYCYYCYLPSQIRTRGYDIVRDRNLVPALSQGECIQTSPPGIQANGLYNLLTSVLFQCLCPPIPMSLLLQSPGPYFCNPCVCTPLIPMSFTFMSVHVQLPSSNLHILHYPRPYFSLHFCLMRLATWRSAVTCRVCE